MESKVNDVNPIVGLSEGSDPFPSIESDSQPLEPSKNIVTNNGELADPKNATESLSDNCAIEEKQSSGTYVEDSEVNADLALPCQDQEPTEEKATVMAIEMDNHIKEDTNGLGRPVGQPQSEIEDTKMDQTNSQIFNKEYHESEETGFDNCTITDIKTIDKADMEIKSTEEISENDLKEDSLIGSDEGVKDIKIGQDTVTKSASAFQTLSSLGVIAQEDSAEESKESLLMKLASRGSISITPSGGGAIPSLSSSLSSSSALPKHKPGPKSVTTKQKSKKIKIDAGKSMDIDKDFDSLISFLSTGSDSEKEENKPKPVENITTDAEKALEVEPEAEIISESCVEQTKSDGVNGVVEETINNDQANEMETESHDESKSVGHSSDHGEDNDDRMSITSQPRNAVEEGSAEILLSAKNVFYNKVQEFNRDMSIAALTVFSEMHQQDPRTRNRGKKRKAADNNESDSSTASGDDVNVFEPGKKSENGITILEALSATGLRSIRYAREIPGVNKIIANDLSEDAVESIKRNIEHNGVEEMVTTARSDASFLMYQQQAQQLWYDAVDLDPYGCPSRFLDSAVQVVRDGGLLLVTCTDMAVLAGNSPETCHAKYGAVSLRSPACHEMAIRIALQCIESHANRYGRYIVPLLSFSADFYIRVIVQVYTSPVTCKRTTSKLSMIYQCTGCQTFTLQPMGAVSQENVNTQPKFSLPHSPPVNVNCFHCHHKHYMGGPIWTAPIYSSRFVENMLRVVEKGRFGTSKRMQGMLEVIREELPDVPLYYTIIGLCTRLHCQAIPLIDIRSAILNAGYRVSSSHAAPTAIKTNAPSKIIWDIMRCWVHMNPVSQKRLVTGSVPATIILEPPNLIANFDIHPKARPSSSMRKLLRYQPNPEKNWGPGMRARCNNSEDDKDEKRRLNQNKSKNKPPTKKTVEIIEVVTIDDEDEATEEITVSAIETAGTTSTT